MSLTVKTLIYFLLSYYNTLPSIDDLEEVTFLKTLWEKEKPTFSPFPTMFSILSKTHSII